MSIKRQLDALKEREQDQDQPVLARSILGLVHAVAEALDDDNQRVTDNMQTGFKSIQGSITSLLGLMDVHSHSISHLQQRMSLARVTLDEGFQRIAGEVDALQQKTTAQGDLIADLMDRVDRLTQDREDAL